MTLKWLIAYIVLLLSLVASLFGHTFYLLPESFVLQPGQATKVYRYIDDAFPAERQDWWPAHIRSFQIIGRKGVIEAAWLPAEGAPKGVKLKFPEEGTYLLAYTSQPQVIKLGAEKFNQYLRDEGLDQILELRKQQGMNKEGRERYTRYSKVLFQIGQLQDEMFKKPAGLKIDILPEQNPYRIKVGEKITVRILFDGKPLTNALVSATYAGFKGNGPFAQRVRTNQVGQAPVSLTTSGPWLVRVVHMLPLRDSKEADWESFWGSLTFAAGELKK